VPLQILNANAGPDPAQVAARMREKIAAAVDGARVTVTPTSPGHYEIEVVSSAFAGRSRVAQQQLVYAAIADLMTGGAAPVHAVDRLTCVVP
jgi:stress-induced morphogen